MANIAELVRAFAALLWPLFAFAALWFFRAELRELLRRLSRVRKGRILGQEIELDEELDQLRASAETAQRAVAALPRPDRGSPSAEPLATFEDELLREAGNSPQTALLLLGLRIERELKQLLAATGWAASIDAAPISDAIERLRVQGSLPTYVGGSLKHFLDVRNRLIHGGGATDKDVLRAIDSGIVLLKAIRAIPTETNIVHDTNVTLYSDAACKQPRADVSGIILETISPGGASKALRIFPTTRKHFQKGKRVAWEWTLDSVWGETWYRDPVDGSARQAWLSSSEFIGRHLYRLRLIDSGCAGDSHEESKQLDGKVMNRPKGARS